MVTFNIKKLLRKNNKTKYWLCQQMNITTRNLNRIIKNETSSISFRYIQDFCKYLHCSVAELITVTIDDKEVS